MLDARRAAWAVFFLAFAAYAVTLPPTLPPYRDAGEMATAAFTLGVAHPPSYPLYVLLGRLAQAVPLADPAFRLGWLSALLGAAALAVLVRAAAPWVGVLPAAAAALWLGANRVFWSVAVVPEMYTLSLLLGMLLLAAALRLRERYDPALWRAACFLYGLALANRTDLLLWAPGLLWLAAANPEFRKGERSTGWWLAATCGWGLLGLSVYLYLPARSGAGPWLDWNQPATLERFLGSLTRKSYGSSLDRLSQHYASGAMFWENLKAWGRHLGWDFLGAALPLVLAGARWWLKRDALAALGLGLAWLASGPLFLYLANLPPNPHALAIVDPHYLLSDVLLALAAAGGLAWAAEAAGPRGAAAAAALALIPFLRPHAPSQRWNLAAWDYARNTLLSMPQGAPVIVREDVQLFSLWYLQRVAGVRPDVQVVAQGLSASPWYQTSRKREGDRVRLGPLATADDWRRFELLNPGSFATLDADVPDGMPLGSARGLVVSLSTAAAPDPRSWSQIVVRGADRYEEPRDFFTADLLEEYALAHQRLGVRASGRGDFELALEHLTRAWAYKWQLPEAAVHIGYVRFKQERWSEAGKSYELAVALLLDVLRLSRLYHSLPAVGESVRHALGEAHLNLGVVSERLGDRRGAEEHYREAIRWQPRSVQARFNLAVLYWDKDWPRVVASLSEAAALDPSNSEVAKYLAVARTKVR